MLKVISIELEDSKSIVSYNTNTFSERYQVSINVSGQILTLTYHHTLFLKYGHMVKQVIYF